MNNYRKFRRNVKAISPVLSVLMMIAVAVAASLVTYAWVMGYLNFTTAKVGKAIQIQSIARDAAGNVTVYVQNVGDSTVQLANVYVDGTLNGATSSPPFGTNLNKTATATINLVGNYLSYARLTVKVVATDGTFIEFTKTF